MDGRVISDCPACCGIRTVFFGLCSVCYAEFDEWHDRDDLHAGAPTAGV